MSPVGTVSPAFLPSSAVSGSPLHAPSLPGIPTVDGPGGYVRLTQLGEGLEGLAGRPGAELRALWGGRLRQWLASEWGLTEGRGEREEGSPSQGALSC